MTVMTPRVRPWTGPLTRPNLRRLAGPLLALPVLVLAMVALAHGLPFDHAVSDLFYTPAGPATSGWRWPKEDAALSFWLHDALSGAFVLAGAGLLTLLVGYRTRMTAPMRRCLALLLAMLVLLPVVVAVLKAESDTFCPNRLQTYGGRYLARLADNPDPLWAREKAQCFPAAHPAPGFALLMLGAAATTRTGRRAGYAVGLAAGLALTLIQIGRGEHFLSHGLATALLAGWLCWLLVRLWPPMAPRYPYGHPARMDA